MNTMETTCPVCANAFDAEREACCPFCGFKLAGRTQEFHPINLDGVGGPEATPAQEVSLRVVRGPQTGMAFAVTGDRMTLGRSPHCDIFLNDMTVSRYHATIERVSGGCYAIRDNHSYNGLWVNNESVEFVRLKSGDYVQIGAFCLQFQEQ